MIIKVKPIGNETEAMFYTGANKNVVREFLGDNFLSTKLVYGEQYINTYYGQSIPPNYWLVKDGNKYLTVLTDEDFKEQFVPVGD